MLKKDIELFILMIRLKDYFLIKKTEISLLALNLIITEVCNL